MDLPIFGFFFGWGIWRLRIKNSLDISATEEEFGNSSAASLEFEISGLALLVKVVLPRLATLACGSSTLTAESFALCFKATGWRQKEKCWMEVKSGNV